MAPTPWSLRWGPMCRGRMQYRRWRSPGLRRTRARQSLASRHNLLKTTERHSILQSTLSWHQSRRAWRFRGLSGSLAKSTRDLSPVASTRLPMVLRDIEGATCARVYSLMLFGRPPLLAQRVDLDVHLYYAAIKYLVYGCENVPQTFTESRDTPPIQCAQHA